MDVFRSNTDLNQESAAIRELFQRNQIFWCGKTVNTPLWAVIRLLFKGPMAAAGLGVLSGRLSGPNRVLNPASSTFGIYPGWVNSLKLCTLFNVTGFKTHTTESISGAKQYLQDWLQSTAALMHHETNQEGGSAHHIVLHLE